MKTITVKEKAPGAYVPVCEAAKLFCALIQNSTIDGVRLEIIEKLGFTVNIHLYDTHRKK